MPISPRLREAAQYSLAVAALVLFAAPMSRADEPVTWTNLVGASASGNTLTKTAVTNAWDAGAASIGVIRDGYGYVEFTMNTTDRNVMLGLATGDSNAGYQDIDFAIHPTANGQYYVYEAGIQRASLGAYAAGDRFRVEVRYGVARYLRNGILVHTGAQSSSLIPNYPLRVDASLHSAGATLTNVRVGNIALTGEVNATISGSTVTKTGAAGWVSGAISADAIESGDGFMAFTATETNTTRAAGLGVGNASQDVADIEFAVKLNDDATLEVTESGVSQGTFGSYAAGDRFRVELRSGVVTFARNGTIFHTSTSATPAYPLRVDLSLYTVGATVADIAIERLFWANETGVTVNGEGLVKTAADGWNAGASTTRTVPDGDAYLEFIAIETNTRRTVGLDSGTASAGSYADIDHAIDLDASGNVTVYESGVSRGTVGTYQHGDRFRIEIHQGTIQYRKNSAVLYVSTVPPNYPVHGEVTLYTSGATVAQVAMGDLVWTNEGGVSIFGSTLRRGSAATGWTAGAASTRAVNSGYVELVATETTKWRMLGLSHGDMTYSTGDVDYGFTMGSSNVLKFEEKAVLKGQWTYATGDRLRIAIESGVVKAYRNGSLLYTSATAPELPLRVDTGLMDAGATLMPVAFVGEAVTDTLEAPTFSPAAGVYSAVSVSIAATPGATIRYTLDGTDPTESSPTYSSPIALSQTTTVKAKAWKPGYTESAVATGVYTLKVATPTMTPGAGTYVNTVTVTVNCATSGVDMHYTTNGVDPTQSDAVIAAGGTVAISSPSTLKVKAWKPGWTESTAAAVSYSFQVATPTLTPAAGSYVGALPVTIATATADATLRYRLDGADPTEADPAVTSGTAITVDRSSTLKVRGWRTAWTASATASGVYWISLGTAATPELTPLPGTYTSNQTVTMTTSTTGAIIRYTLDGTEPGFASPIYASPLLIGRTTSIRAKAFSADMTASSSAGGLYVLDTGAVDAPRFSPGDGTYPTFRDVTVTSETAGATIHYTTNGVEPTESDPVVVSGATVRVDKAMSLRAKAWKSGMAPSVVTHAEYLVTGALAVGSNVSAALKADGTLWLWGKNSFGVFGDPSIPHNTVRTTPGQVPSLTDVVAISAHGNHCLALKRDGSVWFWGQRNGSGSSVSTPTQVSGVANAVTIAAGEQYVATTADGAVWRWGDTGNDTGPAAAIVGLKGASKIAAASFYLALKTDGMPTGGVWSWGKNDQCLRLGNGTCDNPRTVPARVPVADVTAITAGFYHGHVLTADDQIWGWGSNATYRVGDGTSVDRITPVLVQGPTQPVAIHDGNVHGMALAGDGQVWSWGRNDYGVLGTNDGLNYLAPTRSLMKGAIALTTTATAYHNLALKPTGAVWAWGKNTDGQLGDGTTTDRGNPVQVTGFTTTDGTLTLLDSDGDGLDFLAELSAGTDPFNPDTNGDGVLDGAALRAGLSPTNPDMDGDGVSNSVEAALGTDPFRADTDGDGVNDAADAFPLDPTRWQAPAPDPNDLTPPSITLAEPTNATLTSSVPPQ